MSVRIEGQVIVLELALEQDLRPYDLDALVDAVEDWLVTHRELPGLVIHAGRLPGRQILACVLRHSRFVREHRARIHRIALATNCSLPSAVMRLAELAIAAELKQFVYTACDQAVRWSARSRVRVAPHALPVTQPEEI
jgi:hypothetical protein